MIGLEVMGYAFAMNLEENGYTVAVTNWEKAILENKAALNLDKDLIISEKLTDFVQNIEESHETLRFSSSKEEEQIKAKNKRHEEAIEGMRE